MQTFTWTDVARLLDTGREHDAFKLAVALTAIGTRVPPDLHVLGRLADIRIARAISVEEQARIVIEIR